MIPIRLALRNFMCYREGELSFEGLHVACLCGDNGNGKSALLDAMTWALWGKARAKTDDELIHLGRSDMEVEFDFAILQEGQDRYRVIRKRSKPKVRGAGKTLLELQQATDQGFRSISGNSIKETQRGIEKILQMDYDTFINSAYLLQGQADNFSKAEPYKRKEILSNILGLYRYYGLEKLAKNHARQNEAQGNILRSEIEYIEAELANKERYETELREVGDAIAAVETERREWADKVKALTKQNNELDVKREQSANIEERIKQAKETVISLEAQVRDRHRQVEKYENILEGYDGECAEVRAQLDKLTMQEEELEAKRSEFQNTSNQIHNLTSINTRLKEEMKELKGKIDMLAQEQAKCPLCGTELGIAGRESIMSNYKDEGQRKKELFRANEDESRALETGANALKREIREVEQTIKEGRTQWERQAEALEKDHTEAESALPKEREALIQIKDNVGLWSSTLDADTQRLESLNADLAILPEINTSLGTAQQSLDELTRRQAQGRQMLGAVQANLERYASLEQEREEKRVERENVSKDEKIYQELATAFGKKGIQAMLIDGAIPEIEVEANRLLARMTDNRMNVKMETQRARKTREGEPVETLDINISDELGTRRYEMYSGGEAFRIDFAMRIALSKLLARRAGSPLRTLIIDEGFGSQDSSGRERLVEAINSIQDDFDRILVITHIDELKNAFDERIEVTKTEEGSVIEAS
jgi:exonuclease SbcC